MIPDAKLKANARGLIFGLVVQYLLGITTNLYVKFPDNSTVKQLWGFAHGQFVLMAHAIWGVLLLIGALVLVVRSFKSGDKAWKISSGLGFTSILVAGLAGSQFVSTQNDNYSLVMAIFFIVALASYGWALIKAD